MNTPRYSVALRLKEVGKHLDPWQSLGKPVLLGLSLWAAAFPVRAQTLPETDNTAAPYLGVFKDSFGSQDGILHDNFFAWWLNRSSVYAVVFNGNYTWTEIQGNQSYVNAWARWCNQHPNSKIVVSVALLPGSGNNPSGSHAKGARGDYDAYFQALATKIRDAGICDQVIIRLGWEFNGSWYPWRVQPGSAENDAVHFAANFCRVSQTMRGLAATSTTDPGKMPANLQFNWCGTKIWNSYNVSNAYPGNISAGTTSTGVSYPAYSGDGYVHSVGVDIYDTDAAATTYGDPDNTMPWSGSVLSTAWTNIVSTSTSAHNGIAKWQSIANAHGKTMSFPEWGLSTTPESSPNPAGGFDNPYFIQKMYDYCHNATNNVEFQAYFDVPGASNHRISSFPGQTPTVHPNAAEKFRQLFTPPMPDRTNIGTITAATKADGLNVVGAGAGFTGATDSFYFTARPASTEDMFMVELTSASVAAGQGGLMLRQDTTAGAINAALFVSNGNLLFQSRTTSGGSTAQSTVATGVSYPIWLKLVRRGTAISAYSSSDGFNWSYAAGQTLSGLSGTPAMGVAVSSGSGSTLNTVGVDQVDKPDFMLGDETNIAAKVIKDNADATGVTYAGTWATGNTRSDRYGADYRVAPSSAGAATFNPGLSGTGLHTVYVHWPSDRTFSYEVPVTVNHTGGSASLSANQEAGSSLWVYAGTYQLDSSSSVVINSSPNGSTTLADAVMFVPLPGTPSGGNNLALGKTVTFSSEQAGNEAYKAVDGIDDDDNNRWSAETYPQWIEVDLGSNQTFTGTELHAYQDRAYQFWIEAKPAGGSYSTIVDATSNTSPSPISHSFAPVTARYVKLTVTGASGYTGGWISIREFKILADSGGSGNAIDFSTVSLTGYSSQDAGGTALPQDNGATLLMTGNTWKRMDFNYNVTSGTVLEFDFKSTVEGDLHSIGLDTNDNYADNANTNFFQLHGTQIIGQQSYNNYSGTGWIHYTIPIGIYFTGQQNYLFFVNDKDASPFTNTGYFRNVTVHE